MSDLFQIVMRDHMSAAGKRGGARTAETLTAQERSDNAKRAINARWKRERARRAAAEGGGASATAERPNAAAQEATPATRRRATPHQLRSALAIACAALERIAAVDGGGALRAGELARAALNEERVCIARAEGAEE